MRSNEDIYNSVWACLCSEKDASILEALLAVPKKEHLTSEEFEEGLISLCKALPEVKSYLPTYDDELLRWLADLGLRCKQVNFKKGGTL